MRDLDNARLSWQSLHKYRSLPALREAVRLSGPSSSSSASSTSLPPGLRSVCWKAFLLFDNLDTATWLPVLSSSRSGYNALRAHFIPASSGDGTLDPLGENDGDGDGDGLEVCHNALKYLYIDTLALTISTLFLAKSFSRKTLTP